MTTAADYLQLSQTQLTTGYKLRTRVVDQEVLVATNIAPNYTLSVQVDSDLDGVIIDPQSFNLGPNESIELTITFSSGVLEAYTAGTLSDLINFTVSATPVIVPEIPVAPPQPELPPAPRQISARVEMYPNSYTFMEELEVKEFTAILFIDNVAIEDAQFDWEFNENLSQAFTNRGGSVKAVKRGLNRGIVQARVRYPNTLTDAIGLASVATNIPIYNSEPITGDLSIRIVGLPASVQGRVNITGIPSVVSQDTNFQEIPVGTYTITPEVVAVGRSKFNPAGGGQIYLAPGTRQEITITYTEKSIPDENSIVILSVMDSKGNDLSQNSVIQAGEKITVYAQTYKNGNPVDLGEIRVVATNTKEGSIIGQQGRDGKAKVQFTVEQAGEVSITAINQTAGSTPIGKLSAIGRSKYTINIIAPKVALAGQCVGLNAVVLEDGVVTNIPVEIYANGAIVQPGPCPASTPVVTSAGTTSTQQTVVNPDGTVSLQPEIINVQ